MSTSDRLRLAAAAFALGAAVVVGCGGAGECLRYSDCDQGLTCADGKCVVPPPVTPSSSDGGLTSEAGQDSSVGEAGDESDLSDEDAADE